MFIAAIFTIAETWNNLSRHRWMNKENIIALAGVVSGLSACLCTLRLLAQFPVRGHAWVGGQVTIWGRARGCISHTSMFLSLSFSLLKINK